MSDKTGNKKLRRSLRSVKWIEKFCVATGWFSLQKDGEKGTDEERLGKPTFFTRLYRLELDGKRTDTWVRFVFNEAEGWGDFTVSYREHPGTVPTAREAASRRLLSTMARTEELPDMDLDLGKAGGLS